MSASRYVGRVGGLAVALGIGVAVGGGAGTAWASPGEASSDGADQSAAASSPRSAGSAKQSRQSHSARTGEQAGGGSGVQQVRSKTAGVADVVQQRAPGKSSSTVGVSPTVEVSLPHNNSDVALPLPAVSLPAGSGSAGVQPAISAAAVAAAVDFSDSVVSAADAPLMTAASAEPGEADVVESVLGPLPGWAPDTPVESPVVWTVAAAGRRELGQLGAASDPALHRAVSGSADTTDVGSPWVVEGPQIASFAHSTPSPAGTEAAVLTVDTGSRSAARNFGSLRGHGVDINAASVAMEATGSVDALAGVDPASAVAGDLFSVIGEVIGAIIGAFLFPINFVVGIVQQLFGGGASAPTNSAPVVSTPTVNAPDAANGYLVGRINATDPDGDTLTFSGPTSTAKGSVVLNPSTGFFVYTPTATARQNAGKAGATEADKSDSFVVTVSDGQGGSASVTVPVEISPIAPAPVNRPPVVTNPTVGSPDLTTGVVTGEVNATDPDGNTLAYSSPSSTSKGNISLNSSTGSFTYTPTTTARENAGKTGASDADKADAFTVTVSDGQGGSVTVSVDLEVSPLGAGTTPDPTIVNSISGTDFRLLSPDGRYLYGTGYGAVYQTNIATQVIRKITLGDRPNNAYIDSVPFIAIDKNGVVYAVGEAVNALGADQQLADLGLAVINPNSLESTAVVTPIDYGPGYATAYDLFASMAITPDGTKLIFSFLNTHYDPYAGGYTQYNGPKIAIIDTASKRVTRFLDATESIAGTGAIVPNSDGTAWVRLNEGLGKLDLTTGSITQTNSDIYFTGPIVVSPDRSKIYASFSGDIPGEEYGYRGLIAVLDANSGKVIKTLGGSYSDWTNISHLAVSQDGKFLYGTIENPEGPRGGLGPDRLVVIDSTTGALAGSVILQPNGYGRAQDVAVDPQRGAIYVSVNDFKNSVPDSWTSSYGRASSTSVKTVKVNTMSSSAPQSRSTSAELFDQVPKGSPGDGDTIFAEKVVDAYGTTRMIVYMSGIEGFGPNISTLDGIINRSGVLRTDVQEYIDEAYEAWKPDEIQLVGHSNGGMQMQAYASAGTHRAKVTSLVVFGSPLTKTESETSSDAVAFINLDDPVPAVLVSDFADWQSANKGLVVFNSTQPGTPIRSTRPLLYVPGSPANHEIAAYMDWAKKFDEEAGLPSAPPAWQQLRSDILRFGGTVVESKPRLKVPGLSFPVLQVAT